MRRVLIVEDAEDAREGLRMLLEASGYAVETAANGVDGLAKLESCSADAAIIDIDLPGMNGYDIARNARSNAALKSVKLIALTGFGGAKDRQAARDAGFDRHLTKPVSLATLRDEIEQR